ncbi:MAG: hypothetical protein R3191_01205 [Anaerolineales bacterium]|nr:hypothetical protein [Anaerolineales bacterium]
MSENTYKIEITRRPWYEWIAWLVWLFLVVFSFQNAIASGAEYEPQAATIFWGMTIVLLLGGGITYFVRRNKNG